MENRKSKTFLSYRFSSSLYLDLLATNVQFFICLNDLNVQFYIEYLILELENTKEIEW